MKNNVTTKEYLGMEVRVVNDEYIVLKDMFNALGQVEYSGGWNKARAKMNDFLKI